MKEITSENITRFMHNDFVVTVIETDDDFEAWLHHKDYGVSALLFAVPKFQPHAKEITYPGFLGMVESSIEAEIKTYTELYMD